MTHPSRIFQSLENDNILEHSQRPVAEFDHIQPDTIDLLSDTEEGYALAAEALFERARTLESLAESLKDVPESAATPELAAVVQASIVLPDEVAVATESSDDVTDVEAKSERWNNIKSRAAKAASTMAEAVKRIITTIIDFISNVIDWVITSRRSITKELEAQKSSLASAKQVVNVPYNRRLQSLTHSGAFSASIAKDNLGRYAELLAAATYTIQDVIKFTTSFKTMTFKPDALSNFNNHILDRTRGALHWEAKATEKIAEALSGECGLNITLTLVPYSGLSITTQATADNEAAAVEAPFTRGEMLEVNKRALALMKGVAKCEPDIKSVQNSLRRLIALDMTVLFVSQGQARAKVYGSSPTQIFMQMRQFLNFANRIGVGMAVKGAAAAARLGRAYLAGESALEDKAQQEEFKGVIEPKLLTA